MRIALLLLSILFYSTLSSRVSAQISLFDLLYHQDQVKITLTYPFESLQKTNNNDIDAIISIETDSGYYVRNKPVSMSLRGKFRRMKCTFPPILLNFKKSMLEEMHLSDADEIKLVTHCLDGPEGQSNLEEERLMYQVYESLTPLSYRTIWLSVTYCDKTNPGVCFTSGGFFIEPDQVITSRLGIVEKKLYNVSEDSIQFDSYGLMVAFNFMIGNRDWSISGSRNAKLFYDPQQGAYIVIPYDFDYSNVVGASYRRVSPSETMSNPYDRVYQGEYFKNKSGEILKTFHEFEQTVIETVTTAPNPMSNERRKSICRYFDNWFDFVKKHSPEEMRYDLVCPYKGGL